MTFGTTRWTLVIGWLAALVCTAPGFAGACCFSSGLCQELPDDLCVTVNGTPQGGRTTCADGPCLGACCYQDGTCDVAVNEDCEAACGVYQGLGTTCAGTACVGACCADDGECLEVDLGECDAVGGAFLGTGRTCADTGCVGACCFDDGSCSDGMSAAACTNVGGSFAGGGTTCDATACPVEVREGVFEFTLSPGGCSLALAPFDDMDGSRVLTEIVLEVDAEFAALVALTNVSSNQLMLNTTIVWTAAFQAALPFAEPLELVVSEEIACGDSPFLGPGQTCEFGTAFAPVNGTIVYADEQIEELTGDDMASVDLFGNGSFQYVGGVPFLLAVQAFDVSGSVRLEYRYIVPGACCLADGSCVVTDDEAACSQAGGGWQGAATDCSDAACFGACCTSGALCEQRLADDCAASGGTYLGFGTDCATSDCPGACCLPDCSCAELTPDDCSSQGGVFNGEGTACDGTFCVESGACRYYDGSCVVICEPACDDQGGIYQGHGSECFPIFCLEPGACCFPTGTCTQICEPECFALNGIYFGDGTTCEQVQCQYCMADLNGDESVGFYDLITVFMNWGSCPVSKEPCIADLNLNGAVEVSDMETVLSQWGPCPE